MTLEEALAKIAKLEEQMTAVAAKNTELLGELRIAKTKAKGADIDPAEHEKLKIDLEAAQKALDAASKSSKAEIEKLTKERDSKDNSLKKYLIDSNLNEQLAKAGVPPEFMDAARALLKQDTSIKVENDNYVPVIKDKPLAEAIKEWAASDSGKHFVKAPANNGGGAPPNGNNGGAPANTKKLSEWTVEEKTKFIGEHGLAKWSEELNKSVQ